MDATESKNARQVENASFSRASWDEHVQSSQHIGASSDRSDNYDTRFRQSVDMRISDESRDVNAECLSDWAPFPHDGGRGLDLAEELEAQFDQLDDFEQDSACAAPSSGSAMHSRGLCRPCNYFTRPSGCLTGAECRFCHLCSAEDVRSFKLTQRKLKREQGSTGRPSNIERQAPR
eukprot:TRINITY_DN9129_c0_g2_i1.p1 TRINITY_DN9129_c0_g2~~TRINITY_DN9129_c0_g2_i1.p1  ORF type:complete len:176 (-),score=11.70 TRINITY_DN9129_c0_g2_i1:171-698(-)